MKIGFHTDAFNSAYRSFDTCLAWAERNGVHSIECALIDGVSWIHGLGYQPHVALFDDPVLLPRMHADGSDVQTLSFHETNEWHLFVLNDGRIAYNRWDYVDRSAANFHRLWISNPDGSATTVAMITNTTGTPESVTKRFQAINSRPAILT